jgi:hypothetical protein
MYKKTVLALFILSSLSKVWGGRPVHRDLSLDDLISNSASILIVKNLKIRTENLSCGWEVQKFTVEIESVLKGEGGEVVKGSKITFDPSPTRSKDCELRKKNSSGASFSSSRYSSTLDLSKLESLSSFAVFLTGSKGGYQLVADHAIEDVSIVKRHLKQKSESSKPLSQ